MKGIFEYTGDQPPICVGAEFDLFRFLAICWLRLEVARLTKAIENAQGKVRWMVPR